MKTSQFAVPFVASVVWALSPGVSAQTVEVDYGKAEYMSSCAGCHGVSGKGDGHFKEFLTRAPTDLTRLTKVNAGVFPTQRLYDVIDGRKVVAGHGTREMPIWGADYRAQAATQPRDLPASAESSVREAYVRTRINLLVDYIYRLQER